MPIPFIKYNLENHETGCDSQLLIFFSSVLLLNINISLKKGSRNQMLKLHLVCLLVFFLFLQHAVYHWFFQSIKFKEGEMQCFHKNMYKTKLKSTFIFLPEMLTHSSIQCRSFTFWAISQTKSNFSVEGLRRSLHNIQLQVQATWIWLMRKLRSACIYCESRKIGSIWKLLIHQ